MMSSDATDSCGSSVQLGAMDFVPKPFTVLEINPPAAPPRSASATPSACSSAARSPSSACRSLLTMFEQERKSGQLSLIQDQLVAWIDFVRGQDRARRSTELFDSGSHAVMMSLLDWQAGYFELIGGHAGRPGARPRDHASSRSRACSMSRW